MTTGIGREGRMARVGLTAERLTLAAADLADEVGFAEVTLSALARQFDVKVASLYAHVPSSGELRTRVALLALEEMADLAASALAGRAGRDALTAFADVYRSYAREHPGRYAAAHLRLDAETATNSAGVRHAEMMRAILRGYELTGDNQTHAVRLLGSVFHGYVTLELGGSFDHSSPDPQVSWSRVLDSLDTLLRGWTATAGPPAPQLIPRPRSFPRSTMSPQFLSSTPLTASLLRGAIDLEHTDRGLVPHRLPAWARAQYADGQLAMAESQPSGVRLVFRTAATTIELDTIGTKVAYAGAPVRPDGLYDLVVDGQLTDQATVSGGDVLSFDLTSGSVEHRPGPGGTVAFTGLPAQAKDVEIWLPHNETTVLVELRTDAPVEAVTGDTRPVWLHHGSSISQGSNAASPSTTWPAIAASAAGVDLVNLGFGGSALLDPFTARTMRDQPADLISVAIGINLVNTDLMRLRALTPAVHGFLDTIRDGHPTTPLLVVSAIHCPMQEDTPGPITIDPATYGTAQVQFMATGNPAEVAAGKLTLRVIREELARIVASRAEADLNLHYLDGLELYGEADGGALPLPDKLHPDAATHRLIARRFAEHVFAPNGPFGG